MSTELTRYGSTTLAAGALHQDITGGSSRNELRRVFQAIPQGASAVVQFYISTDDATSAGTRVHHAATALFENQTGRSLKVTATIASYESGRYRTAETGLENCEVPALKNAASADEEKSSVVTIDSRSATGSEEVVVARHPLMSASGASYLKKELNSPTYRPLLEIAGAIQAIFAQGIPLPTQQRFHYCTFSVMLSWGPLFFLHRGVRGTGEEIATSNPWESVCSGNASDGEYERQVAVAKGRALPYQLDPKRGEKNVRLLAAATAASALALPPPDSPSHPQIEEITNENT